MDGHRFLRKGLAYESVEVPVNWVEELGTAIANEEVLPDGTSERGAIQRSAKPPMDAQKCLCGASLVDRDLTARVYQGTCNATGLGNQLVLT